MSKTRVYKVTFTTSEMKQTSDPEYFMSLSGAKAALNAHGYQEISPEDFDDNTCARWKHESNGLFAESFAYIGFIEAGA